MSSNESQLWLTRADMAALLGVTPAAFDQGARRFAGRDDQRRNGRCVLFNASAIMARWIGHKRMKAGRCPCCGAAIDGGELELASSAWRIRGKSP